MTIKSTPFFRHQSDEQKVMWSGQVFVFWATRKNIPSPRANFLDHLWIYFSLFWFAGTYAYNVLIGQDINSATEWKREKGCDVKCDSEPKGHNVFSICWLSSAMRNLMKTLVSKLESGPFHLKWRLPSSIPVYIYMEINGFVVCESLGGCKIDLLLAVDILRSGHDCNIHGFNLIWQKSKKMTTYTFWQV